VAPPARETTVLVVEDDPALRTFYRTTSRIAGYIVISVEDGIDALRQVESDTPNLVILDMGLPRLGGLDVQAELKSRAETRHIPIMVVRAAPRPATLTAPTCLCDANAGDGRGVGGGPVERCLRQRG
jgi:CheY-like chemotaxis protein